MGIFDFLLSNTSSSQQKDTQDTTQKNTTNTGTQQTQNQTQNATGQTGTTNDQTTKQTGTTTQTGQTQQTTLSPEVQSLLTTLVNQFAGNVNTTNAGVNPNVSGLQALAATAGNNATDTGAVDQQIKSAQDVAKLDFSNNEQANISNIQQQVGSKGNTFSSLLQQQGDTALATQLANIDSTTRAQNRTSNTNDIQAAISALTGATSAEIATDNQPLSQVLSIVQALSGATTTSDTSQSTIQNLLNQLSGQSGTTSSSTQSLSDILSSLTNTQSDATQSTTATADSKGKTTQGLLGQITSLISAVNQGS